MDRGDDMIYGDGTRDYHGRLLGISGMLIGEGGGILLSVGGRLGSCFWYCAAQIVSL